METATDRLIVKLVTEYPAARYRRMTLPSDGQLLLTIQ